MTDILHNVFRIEISLFIGLVTSLVLAILLLMIHVPVTDYSRKIAKSKDTIAVSFLICSAFMAVSLYYSGIQNYESFVAVMMFIVTGITTVLLSYALMNVLEEGFINIDKFTLNLLAVCVVSVILVKAFQWESVWFRGFMKITATVLFLIQTILHILYFIKLYRKCVNKIQLYYDEEEDRRLRWVKFCYGVMMLTQVFILVYLNLPRTFMKAWILWYSLFMLYFTANFISFVGSHKLMLDAFAHTTLSGRDLKKKFDEARNVVRTKNKKKVEKEPVAMPGYDDSAIIRLENALNRWVAEKKFCEFDKTRDDIAAELRTTKEFLQLYFTTKVGLDFRTWRTQLRIEESKKLLLENREASIQIIAEASGFSDKSNFHRQFVKIVGCSPKEWRDTDGKPSLD